jgi:hypothetical protein
MDSTIIDGRNLTGSGTQLSLVLIHSGFATLKNLHFIGHPEYIIINGRPQTAGILITECFLENTHTAVGFWNGINRAENLFIKNIVSGIAMLGNGINDISYGFDGPYHKSTAISSLS